MPWIIDGNNVLGAMGGDRHADGPKRELVRLLAGFARQKRTRVTAVFDGQEPPSFARDLGFVTVVFSAGRSADDVIAERVSAGRGWNLVTADRGLAARAARREVRVVAPAVFVKELESAGGNSEMGAVDWTAWFSDPQNRTKF